ncbi:hypothetical protein PRABACTJOHN_04342 [Parabacteroides johnsonii DSM 18315]|uniref:Uncharacterized protein n=1 Tax=Parabacteroides johnsonii DSM 18315 TaxID=537006 RepID=B7BGZ3_9BACT|nr:hypothetical protein PRABACTJOHN_04342 [Parabacteroides johnsonii DSM 18315]
MTAFMAMTRNFVTMKTVVTGGKSVLLSTRRFPDIFTCKLLKCKIIFYLQ